MNAPWNNTGCLQGSECMQQTWLRVWNSQSECRRGRWKTRILTVRGGDTNGQLGTIFFHRVCGLPMETSIPLCMTRSTTSTNDVTIALHVPIMMITWYPPPLSTTYLIYVNSKPVFHSTRASHPAAKEKLPLSSCGCILHTCISRINSRSTLMTIHQPMMGIDG